MFAIPFYSSSLGFSTHLISKRKRNAPPQPQTPAPLHKSSQPSRQTALFSEHQEHPAVANFQPSHQRKKTTTTTATAGSPNQPMQQQQPHHEQSKHHCATPLQNFRELSSTTPHFVTPTAATKKTQSTNASTAPNEAQPGSFLKSKEILSEFPKSVRKHCAAETPPSYNEQSTLRP
jgi:hypothetical protein